MALGLFSENLTSRYTRCFELFYDFISWFLQLLPLLASALEFGSAAAPALTALLKMGSWLATEEFTVKVSLFPTLDCGCICSDF